MLRTNNKRLHLNLWTLAHFLGSALVFVGFFFIFVSIVYVPHGAYTSVVNSNLQLSINTDNLLTFEDFRKGLFPCTRFLVSVFALGLQPTTIVSKYLLLVGMCLDMVLWFNVVLWTLQLMVFVPDACFHWLEKKKEE